LQSVELQNYINNNTDFVFKQLIVWNKKFKGCKNEGFLQGFIEPEMLRNYQKMAEYCLYYTFRDETGRIFVDNDIKHYSSLRNYSKKLQEYIGLSLKQITKKVGRRVEHFFYHSSKQFSLPTKKSYKILVDSFELSRFKEYREYDDLKNTYNNYRNEYEGLVEEIESKRYCFNNQKTHHSIWNYDIAPKIGHITPKPLALIRNIILHSSNESDVVFDCFCGFLWDF
jgi:site-specific DNA-methyltransferase (adenine-specific)